MNAPTAAWTIGQLATLVAEALAADVPGQANGRVREVPDVRTLRWYTSIGLLDRPAAMRGRTALYGRRHLLQVVAVKRLAGEGWSLAEIQERLIGANEVVLESIAAVSGDGFDVGPGLPSDVGSDVVSDAGVPQDAAAQSEQPEQPGSAARRSRFWAVPAGAADGTGSGAGHVTVSRSVDASGSDTSVVEAELSALEVQSSRSGPTGKAELAKLAGPTAQAQPEPMPQGRPQPPAAALPPRLQPDLQLDLQPEVQPQRDVPQPTLAAAIRLAPDVTLVLDTDHAPEPADLTDIAEAARPLLDLLRRLGLAGS